MHVIRKIDSDGSRAVHGTTATGCKDGSLLSVLTLGDKQHHHRFRMLRK